MGENKNPVAYFRPRDVRCGKLICILGEVREVVIYDGHEVFQIRELGSVDIKMPKTKVLNPEIIAVLRTEKWQRKVEEVSVAEKLVIEKPVVENGQATGSVFESVGKKDHAAAAEVLMSEFSIERDLLIDKRGSINNSKVAKYIRETGSVFPNY